MLQTIKICTIKKQTWGIKEKICTFKNLDVYKGKKTEQ